MAAKKTKKTSKMKTPKSSKKNPAKKPRLGFKAGKDL
jgi:hypothetical protein